MSNQKSSMSEGSFVDDLSRKRRVSKACESCRAKKSRCDGKNPCSLCTAQKATCIYREGKKPVNRPVPPGYVEMLEAQQSKLVQGVQRLHQRVMKGEPWPGPLLDESQHGYPLTHDILSGLGILRPPPGERDREVANMPRRGRPTSSQRRDQANSSNSGINGLFSPASEKSKLSHRAQKLPPQLQLTRAITAPELPTLSEYAALGKESDTTNRPGAEEGWSTGGAPTGDSGSDSDGPVRAMCLSFLDFDSVAPQVYGLHSKSPEPVEEPAIKRVYTL
ncbi:MAG: hypothetical protein M1814_002072 [Vezdaea aestivalis]|nr:MAG: hypothetical protein M1814_002072 [Vezdaea aestivalis]